MKLYEMCGDGLKNRVCGYKASFAAENVLRASALLRDKNIADGIKVRSCLKLLLKRLSYYRAMLLPRKKQRVLLDKILAEITTGEKSSRRIVDFNADSALIYAALRQSYNLDLRRDKVDWRLLPALISNVGSDTRLYEVMKIRATEIPPRTKSNAEYVDRLIRLKNTYNLDKSDYSDGLERLFGALSASVNNRKGGEKCQTAE